MDALIERIDFAKIVQKSNLEAMVARSSSGLFLQFVDVIRIRIVAMDLFVQRLARGKCCMLKHNVPASPEQGRIRPQENPERYSTKRERAAARIVEVQGGYSGIVSRAVSWFLDELVILGSFALCSVLAEGLAQMVNNGVGFELNNVLLATILYALWGVQYRVLSLLLMRRTLGMFVLGLKLVNRHGKRPSVLQILIRQALQPWLGIFLVAGGPAFFLAWQRHDGRFIHDLMTGTGFVYSWDVRMAKLRLERMEDSSTFDDADFGMDNV